MLPLPIRYFPDGTACWTKTFEYFAVFIIPLIQKKISNAASVVKGHSLTCVLQMNVNTHSCIRHLTPLYIFMIVLNFGSLRIVVTVCYIFISHHFFFFCLLLQSYSQAYSLDSITNNYEIMVQDLYCHYINKCTRKLLSLSSAKQLIKKEI